MTSSRDIASGDTTAAKGWRFERLTPPSRVFGANGLRTGPDGRIYIAQLIGSQISALDVNSGEIEHIVKMGGDMIAPDDIAFTSQGDMYVTEPMDGRVSVRTAGGLIRLLRDDLPGANGITTHRDRLFVNECRPSGRLMEISLDGRELRTMVSDLPMPNAMDVGPDGYLYYPLQGADEIWRINPDGGEPERVIGDLGHPNSLKVDKDGYVISGQMGTGEVLRIDPRSGTKQILAHLEEGLDNITFIGDRIFVSHFWNGQLTEVIPGGLSRSLIPGGLNWPLGLAWSATGELFIADGFSMRKLPAEGGLQIVGVTFAHGFPVMMPRGLAPMSDGRLAVTTMGGHVYKYRPGEPESELVVDNLDQPYGIVVSGDAMLVAEQGAGRLISVTSNSVEVVAIGLNKPTGVALAGDGSVLVSEAGAGRVVKVRSSAVETVVDGLRTPQGLAVRGNDLYIIDAGSKSLVVHDLEKGTSTTIAEQLPVGPPPGVVPKPLKGMQPMLGPVGNFADLAIGEDGTIYMSGDADGTICALRSLQ